jgi:hypothetical protein
MVRVLVDADNVAPRRLQPVLTALGEVTDPVQLTASGRLRDATMVVDLATEGVQRVRDWLQANGVA